MHSLCPPLLHRHLKADNILIDGDFNSMHINTIKIGDFDLATMLYCLHLRNDDDEHPIGTLQWSVGCDWMVFAGD